MSSLKMSKATLAALAAMDQVLGPPKYEYVLGFVMSESHVLLKESDVEWMKGCVNGYGGKVIPEDLGPVEAMQREFVEHFGPVGRHDLKPEWRFLGVVRGPDFVMTVFSAYVRDIEREFSNWMHELYRIDDLMDINCVYDVLDFVTIAAGQHGNDAKSEFVFVREYERASDWEQDPVR